MKVLYRVFVGSLCLAVIAALALATVPARADSKNDNAALVNGTAIPMQDYERELQLYLERRQAQGTVTNPGEVQAVQKQVLENLIAMELLNQESEKKQIVADDAAVDEQLNAIRRRFPEQSDFEAALDRMDITEVELTAKIRERIRVGKLLNEEIDRKVIVPDVEVQSFYDNNRQLFESPPQVRARHILIRVAPDADPKEKAAAREKMAAVQERLKKGEDFATVASEMSEGPTKSRGGDLGLFSRGQMVKPFEEAAFSLEPGQVSGVVETRFGLHVIKVEEKVAGKPMALADVRDDIKRHLHQQESQRRYRIYIQELREKADIKTYI